MNILDDPRQFPTRLEWPTTYEGADEFGKWDAKFMDLDELPVEEYMKPMPVNVVSGGTPTPGPTPTPSGDTKYEVKFTVSGSVIAAYQITSGETVPAEDVPTPTKEGYTFSGWTPDPETTVITATTDFNGWFVAEQMYYSIEMLPVGSPLDPSVFEFCNVEDVKGGKTFNFTIPISEEYADMYEQKENEEITEDEFDEWREEFIEENYYAVRILSPMDCNLVSITDAGNVPIIVPSPTTVTIDGKEYKCYDIEDEQFYPVEYEQDIQLTITIA